MPYIGQGLTEGRRRAYNFVATSNQTVFQANYDIGYVDVFQNGILLSASDYTATNGTTVVLGVGASASDEITIIAHQIFSVNDTVSASQGGSFSSAIDVTGNITTTGSLRGPSSFTIDPATHGDNTGTVVIAGDLTVNGTTTTINSTTLTVDDKNIIIASGTSNSSTADGSGLTVDLGSDGTATMTYTHATTSFNFNKEIHSPGLNTSSDIHLSGDKGIFFEGSTNDAYEVYLRAIDATGDRSIRLPDASGTLLIQDTSNDVTIQANTTTSGVDPQLTLYKNDTGNGSDGDNIASIGFKGTNSSGGTHLFGWIESSIVTANAGSEEGKMRLSVAGSNASYQNEAYAGGAGIELFNDRTRVRGGVLELANLNDTAIIAGDKLGTISFIAPNEASGGDSILAPASIYAEARSTFSSTSNRTDLVFTTAETGTTNEIVRMSGQDTHNYLQITSTSNSTSSLSMDDPALILLRADPNVTTWDYLGAIHFKGYNSTDQETIYNRIVARPEVITDGSEYGVLQVVQMRNGSEQITFDLRNNRVKFRDEQVLEWQDHKGTSYECSLDWETPTSNRTVTFPNATGTVVLSNGFGATITSNSYNILTLVTDNNDSSTNTDGIFKISTGSSGTTKAEFRYDESEDTVQIAYGDHGRSIVIDSAGEVGIGTATPSADLHVENGSNNNTGHFKMGHTRQRRGYVGINSSQTRWYKIMNYASGEIFTGVAQLFHQRGGGFNQTGAYRTYNMSVAGYNNGIYGPTTATGDSGESGAGTLEFGTDEALYLRVNSSIYAGTIYFTFTGTGNGISGGWQFNVNNYSTSLP